jgi:arylsulfatase A-like enzyme
MSKDQIPQPNVLFISVDQWPAYLLGCAGHPVIQTPTIDHLAKLGTRFSNAYAESPICIPSRRSMMTGQSPRGHGDRSFNPTLRMPQKNLLAQTFRDSGYQSVAIGKLHVYPPRDRIGFDDVLLAEEGRPKLGAIDDYEMYLAAQGHPGEQFLHGMNNNDYLNRPWHLDEECHVTNWITREAARTIKRRDPTRPSFWHVSYTHPHPPLAPLKCYLDMYRDIAIDSPIHADWEKTKKISALDAVRSYWPVGENPDTHKQLRQAFYALCTHIDHQIRIILGTLREEDLLDNTIILFTSDHGDMLGDFGLWAKRMFYQGSSAIPMILIDTAQGARVRANHMDTRLVGLQDIMPTLLDLAGIAIPSTVEGLSMAKNQTREFLYGECREDSGATRMLHDGRHKLIWYPGGNVFQLFDLEQDPRERVDLSDHPDYQTTLLKLQNLLVQNLHGVDLTWVKDGKLIGFMPSTSEFKADRAMSGQRGLHFPSPPLDPAGKQVGSP